MGLWVYGSKEPGYQELDINELTHEQAIEIVDMIHRVALDYSEIKELVVMSARLARAIRWITPKLVTILDVKQKPLHTWREHPFMSPSIYHEFRELLMPFMGAQRLPAWEMLP